MEGEGGRKGERDAKDGQSESERGGAAGAGGRRRRHDSSKAEGARKTGLSSCDGATQAANARRPPAGRDPPRVEKGRGEADRWVMVDA